MTTAGSKFNYINSGSYSMPNGGRSETNSSQGLIDNDGLAAQGMIDSATYEVTPN